MSVLAENLVFENPVQTNSPEVQDFNNYFLKNDYDAFLIDGALKGNTLLFTLIYIFNKQNFKA